MGTFDPLSKAKQLAEQATQTALEAKEHAAMRAGEIRDMAASKAEEAAALATGLREHTVAKLGDLMEILGGRIADAKGVAFTTIKEMTDDLNKQLPALREAGYAVSEVSVELGLPPKVIATFTCAETISEERFHAVIEEHKEAKVTVLLLRAFYAAHKLQEGIKIAGMKPHAIALKFA